MLKLVNIQSFGDEAFCPLKLATLLQQYKHQNVLMAPRGQCQHLPNQNRLYRSS